ncbi:hypothetical protein SESBI_22588 [Sesbania bispinosa]|nr:hypothetical protein SESBI_22588 [Sesbania bispinosa]
MIRGEKSVDKDTHGDWLLVSRNKKLSKSKAPAPDTDEGNLKDSKRTPAKDGPTVNNNKETISFAAKNNVSDGPTLLIRKKRQRKEPTFVPIKVFTDADYQKKGPKSVAPTPNKEAHSAHNTTQEPLVKLDAEDIRDIIALKQPNNGPKDVKHFSNGLKTTMHVEMIAPNHLRFVDEPKAPDPNAIIEDPPSSDCNSNVDMDGTRNGDEDCDHEMVEESPLGC